MERLEAIARPTPAARSLRRPGAQTFCLHKIVGVFVEDDLEILATP